MKEIKGINFDFPFDNIIKVADLIYYDGPLLSHYINNKGDNYLFYWVDVDNKFNRWLFFRTDLYTLQKYIQKQISLYEIVSNSNDGFVYFVDIDNKINYFNCMIVLSKNIEEQYLPEKDSFYEFNTIDDIDLYSLSKNYKSGLLELYLKGGGIKYGSIPFDKFSVIMPKIEEVRKQIASSFIKNIKNDKINKPTKDEIRNLKLDTKYEYIYDLAGSFRVILKPENHQTMMKGNVTYADKFAEEFISLIESGYEKEKLLYYSRIYDKNLIKKYNNLIKYLDDQNMGFGLKWCNAFSDIKKQKFIKSGDTAIILKNLSEFEYDEIEKIKIKGRFYSLNIHTGGYSFESNEEDFKSTGKIDREKMDKAMFISFTNVYSVEIKRQTKEMVGAKQKIIDTIISFKVIDGE